MRTAQEIYDAYRIMPSLQLHQLRVASAGKMIADHFSGPLDANAVILACLFHDMGNIIKSDLDVFPDFLKPEGHQHWQSVKNEYVAKYGNDSHRANVMIARELGLPAPVVSNMDSAGFSRLANVLASENFELKIFQYCDMRVGPFGILSIGERLEEARKRYDPNIKAKDYYERQESFQKLSDAAYGLEEQVFSHCSIKSEDINDASAAPFIGELRNYPVA